MQFRQYRRQDEKDMAFETFGALDERKAFAYTRNNFSSTQLVNDPYGVGKLSIS